MADTYISIPEFARRAGVSHQAVYKELDKKLKPYLQLESATSATKSATGTATKKMLSIKALSDLYGVEPTEKSATGCATTATESATDATSAATIVSVDSAMESAIAALRDQLEAKDRQMAEKDKQLAEKDKQIGMLHELLGQQNALALGDKKAILQLTGGGEPDAPENGEAATAHQRDEAGKRWFQFWK